MCPIASPIACRCGQLAYGGATTCDECKKKTAQSTADRRDDDATRKRYNSAAWRRFRAAILAHNVICQAYVEHPTTQLAEQCHAPATEIHHLKSPRTRPDKMFTVSNVVVLCKAHHHKGQGEPDGERDPKKYVPTRFRNPNESAAHDVN
jgi:hypothetical protein